MINIGLSSSGRYSDVLYYKWENGIFIEHKGEKNSFCYPVALNPFKILDLNINSSDFEAELHFKQKLFEEKNYSSEIALAYEIIRDPNLFDSMTYFKKDNDERYYVLEYTIFYCTIVGDYQGVLNHILENKNLLYKKDKFGKPLLNIASRYGHFKVCEILLEYGAEVDSKDENGSTPLHAAAFHGHESIIQLLLSYGADINCKNILGETPSDEVPTQRYKNLIISSNNDSILNIYSLLRSMKLVDKIIKVKKYNTIFP